MRQIADSGRLWYARFAVLHVAQNNPSVTALDAPAVQLGEARFACGGGGVEVSGSCIGLGLRHVHGGDEARGWQRW